MQKLSGVDPMFHYSESSTTPLEVAYLCIFDPSTAREGYSFERIRDQLGQRLPLLPPFRRRLLEVPFGLDHPRWVDDPEFDLDQHLHRIALPPGSGEGGLADCTADALSEPLDLSRPPWEMSVIEGLGGGLFGVLTKVHHAAIDGVSGTELIAKLLDFAPQTDREVDEGPWEPEALPSTARLIGDSLSPLVRLPLRATRAAWQMAGTALNLARFARRSGLETLRMPLGAPMTSISSRISSRRSIAFAELPLDQVKAVKEAMGVTVNDVVLEMCSGALRTYLHRKGEDPDGSLVAVVPVSVRTETDKEALGNRLSAMFVPLASDMDDPVVRLQAIAESTRAAKEQEKATGLGPVASQLVDALPPIVMQPAVRLATRLGAVERLRPGNLVVSNLVGPPFALYFAGAQLRSVYPVGPIVDGIGLNITVQSYLDSMYFGLNACPKAVPQLWQLADDLVDALPRLTKAASG